MGKPIKYPHPKPLHHAPPRLLALPPSLAFITFAYQLAVRRISGCAAFFVSGGDF
jgi:hypothetical protein